MSSKGQFHLEPLPYTSTVELERTRDKSSCRICRCSACATNFEASSSQVTDVTRNSLALDSTQCSEGEALCLLGDVSKGTNHSLEDRSVRGGSGSSYSRTNHTHNRSIAHVLTRHRGDIAGNADCGDMCKKDEALCLGCSLSETQPFTKPLSTTKSCPVDAQ
jgi:hypothetical protein